MFFFFFKQKTAYEIYQCDWSSDVCSSDLYSFEQVFSKQVAALGGENDALIAISTSGSSPNILRALETANTRSMLTVGLTGSDCDRMAPLCDICLDVNNTSTPRVQEVHHLILHIIAELIEIRLFAGQEA